MCALHRDPNAVAVQRETWTIPIVFATVSDPVASGVVARLDRPGGNITGVAIYEASLEGKWLPGTALLLSCIDIGQ
jgi:hypothetical protein